MNNLKKLALLVFAMALLSVSAFAYTSDRYDVGNVDFGGATVTIVSWYDPTESFKEGGEYAGRLEEAKELFNIGDIQFLQIPWGPDAIETFMSRFMSGDSRYDIWMLDHANFFNLRTAGALYPVGDILGEDYYAKLPYQFQRMAEIFSHKGKKYTYTSFNGIVNNTVFLVFNKTLLDREGIPYPYEYYHNNQWNWDTLTEVAKKVTRDTDGDGTIDQWGLTVFNGPDYIHANGGAITKLVDGKETFVADQVPTVNALKQMREWEVELGLVGGTWEIKEFFSGRIAFANMPTWKIKQLKDGMEDEYGVVPLPMGPDADDYHYPSDNVDSMYIPANAADPKALVALDNFLWTIEEFEESMEDQIIEMASDRDSFEIIKRGIDNWTGEAAYMSWCIGRYYESVWGSAYQVIKSGEKTAAEATAKIKPE